MKERIRNCDGFSQKFSFHLNKKTRTYQTKCGGVLTLLVFILSVLVALRILIRFLNTEKPVVSVNKVRLSRPAHIDLIKSQVSSAYITFNGVDFLKVPETAKYFTFYSGLKTTTRDSKGGFSEHYRPKMMVSCLNTSTQEMREMVKIGLTETSSAVDYTALFSESVLCADNPIEEFHIEGSKAKLPYKSFDVKIYPCSLEDASQCASLQELTWTQIGIAPMIKVANYSRKRQPLNFFMDADGFFYIDVASKTQITFYYKKNLIFDNDIDMVDQRFTQT